MVSPKELSIEDFYEATKDPDDEDNTFPLPKELQVTCDDFYHSQYIYIQ